MMNPIKTFRHWTRLKKEHRKLTRNQLVRLIHDVQCVWLRLKDAGASADTRHIFEELKDIYCYEQWEDTV